MPVHFVSYKISMRKVVKTVGNRYHRMASITHAPILRNVLKRPAVTRTGSHLSIGWLRRYILITQHSGV